MSGEQPGGYLLDILGVPFRFESDMGEFLGRCLKLHYGELAREEGDARGEWLVEILYGKGDEEGCYGESVMEVTSGSVRIHIGIDINNRTIRTASIGSGELGEQEKAGYFFVCIGAAVQIGLSESGIVVFHGAAAEKDGKAVLIAGGNGSGKSTLVKKLLSSGWEYLADDSATVTLEGGVAKALRNPELVNVAGLDSETIAELKKKGFMVAPDDAFLAPPVKSVAGELREIVFPSISVNGSGKLLRLTDKEFLLKLMEVRKTPFGENEYEGFFDMCLSIVGGARGFRYEMKNGEAPSADEFAEMLSQL